MDKQEKESPPNPRDTKRIRMDGPVSETNQGLYLAFQLTIPYLPVGDLGALAACNRACRVAALAAYDKRLDTPFPIRHALVSDEPPAALTLKPWVMEATEEVPLCYRTGNPWSHVDFQKYGDSRPVSLSSVALTADSDKLEWRGGSNLLEWNEGILHRPEELPNTPQCYVVHYDLRGTSLFVTIAKFCSLSGEEADEYDEEDEDTAKELWGLLYDLDVGGSYVGHKM
jgi:hypothetical protein